LTINHGSGIDEERMTEPNTHEQLGRRSAQGRQGS
jgi:hypothetical protein